MSAVMSARSDQTSTKVSLFFHFYRSFFFALLYRSFSQANSLAECLPKIALLRSTLTNIPPFQDYAEHLDQMKHVSLVFEVEVKAGLKDWEGLMILFKVRVHSVSVRLSLMIRSPGDGRRSVGIDYLRGYCRHSCEFLDGTHSGGTLISPSLQLHSGAPIAGQ
jgi:hypothetical protein